MDPRFRITIGSDPDHEDLVGELYFAGQIVCVLTQERGYEAMEIELHVPRGEQKSVLPAAAFFEALEHLRKRMQELRRIEPGPGA
ncbi:MAG: hypothetical protein HZA52_04155 [Planctomycetes bacterium]|nr:hypothetical protein [Planctomycetota bacterium]